MGFLNIAMNARNGGVWQSTWKLHRTTRQAKGVAPASNPVRRSTWEPALIPQPIYRAVGGDEQLTIRIVSALLVIMLADSIWRAFAERHEWGAGWFRSALAIIGAQLVVQLANVLTASLPLLLFGLLLFLIFPMQLFLRVIRDFQPPTEDG